MDVAKLQRLKSRAKQMLREHEAILALSNLLASDIGLNLRLAQEQLAAANSVSKLERYIEVETETVGRLRRSLGITVPNSELVDFFNQVQVASSKIAKLPSSERIGVAKLRLKRWFPNLAQFLPNFDNLPNHAKIFLRLPGDDPIPSYDWLVVEVLLFEDMCALFNCALEMQPTPQAIAGRKRAGKRVNALIRAAISTAIYFLAAYLNGIAIDFYVDNHKRLDDRDKTLLLEQDLAKKRRVTVGLRDKILQYPRIILSLKDPPLNETNCPEIAFVLSTAKQLRDAVAHASSITEPGTLISEKEFWIVHPDLEQLKQIVDNTIALVRKIETITRGTDKRLFWLHGRGADGAFDAKVFR